MVNTEWHELFLRGLRKTPIISYAAKLVGIPRCLAYEHRERFPEFASAWDDAITEGIESLEIEAINRAKRISDTLLIFMLKAHKPAKYRETVRSEVSGVDGQPIRIVTAQDLSDDELAAIASGALR